MNDLDPGDIGPPQSRPGAIMRRSPPLLLLLALLLQIVVSPQFGRSWVNLAFQVAIIIAAAAIAADSRRHLRQVLALAIPATVLVVVGDLSRHDLIDWAGYLVTVALYLHVIRLMLGKIFGVKVVTLDVIALAICTYVLLGAIWVLFYLPLLAIDPAAFAFASPVTDQGATYAMTYFSYVTLTTLGYGDIMPVSPLARSLAAIEALTGVLFLAVLISRLVGSYRSVRD